MVDCSGFINPLNLECWFVNVFSGSLLIASVLLLFVLVYLSARFRMPNFVLGIFFLLAGVIFYNQAVWILWISIIGFVFVTVAALVRLFR